MKSFILLILILLIGYIRAQGLSGYFDNGGTCTKGHESCATGENATEGTSGSNRFLNSTTKLCELCPDGKFYSDALNTCLDCNGSCSAGCAYQTSCFEGPTDQFFDLTRMKCVTSCGSSQFIFQKFGRDLEFYVDPDGTEIVELGTKKYPYK